MEPTETHNIPTELTEEQLQAIEESTERMTRRIEKAVKIWKKIKTPLIVAGAATGGFLLRGALSTDECPYEDDEEFDEDHDTEQE